MSVTPIVRLLLVTVICGWFCDWTFAQRRSEPLTAERVAKSITRGVDFLKGKQTNNGVWSRQPSHTGGVTALCTLALLNCGVELEDRVIQRSMQRLNGIDIDTSSVYAVSLMTMVYCLGEPDNIGRIRECVNYLVETQVERGGRRGGGGGWPYTRVGGRPDSSNSQFALLALHEASLLGIKVDQRVWRDARWYWEEDVRHRNGGFFYTSAHPSVSGSMTCAGMSSLIIIDENLPKQVPFENGRVVCCGENDRLEYVESASDWLGKHFSVRRNPTQGALSFSRNTLYFLYGLERAARLSGQRYFGEHDWYREGAEFLALSQRGDGSWRSSAGHGENDPNVATALALLFMSKGRRPIVIGKYKHSDDNDWDRHRKGVHYLTRALEADWNTKLNWQTIDGRYATADDLLEAPVLFISGRDSLNLGAKQKDALRKYIEFGGFIFAEACQGDGCGENVGFDREFRELMAELFPDSELQLLERDHPVYSAQYNLETNPDRPLWGLQSSCRTSVIYCSTNMAGIWRVNRPSFMAQIPERGKNQVTYATQLGINVVSYATGRELKDKLDRPKVIDSFDDGVGQRVVLIPKLSHGGGADDAPNAWQNVIRRARFDLKQRFKLERQFVPASREHLAKHPMVFMHGQTAFQFSDEEREALSEYFRNGGFLFADSICSAQPFVKSFESEIQKIFPDQKLEPILQNDRIWSARDGGYKVDQVSMHEPAAGEPGGVRRTKSPPKMFGIKQDDRWVVVFSPYDLSCALENAAAQQCVGYDTDDAARLGVNIILYALNP